MNLTWHTLAGVAAAIGGVVTAYTSHTHTPEAVVLTAIGGVIIAVEKLTSVIAGAGSGLSVAIHRTPKQPQGGVVA